MNRFANAVALPLFVLACAAGSVQAAETAATFKVRMVVEESCTIGTTGASDIDFLTHTRSTGEPVSATGTLTVKCSAGTPYAIGLSSGLHSTGGAAPAAGDRRMANGTQYVPYDLYRDGSFSNFWGNTEGTDMQSGTGTAADQSYTVHGRVASTNAPAGTYTDTVIVRVVY